MKKITFIGAGSFGFTRTLIKDILTFDAFKDARLTLMDIDSERLSDIKSAIEKIKKAGKYSCEIEVTTDRKKALEGTDGVVITILNGGIDIWRRDIEIPKKYGVDTNVGDTRGPSGIFRYLRTATPMLDIARDIGKYCPDAIFLNYTNPMAMLCRMIQQVVPHVTTTGLCHSVQGTAMMLAGWIGAPYDEITYTCAGINHQAFYTEFKRNGVDAYPDIRKAITENEAIYNEEIVRNEMYLALNYYVTESSGHNSEYNAWFRKRPDLIEKYCTHGTGWNPGVYAYILDEYVKREHIWRDEIKKYLAEPVDLARGHEYASSIFNACFGDGTIFEFNGNVRNFGLIENLPQGCCVEVPAVASKRGISAIAVGKLPAQCALLCSTSAQIEELVVDGFLTGDREKIYHAVCYDPLSSAVLSLKEIRAMVDELFDQYRPFLPMFF